MSKKARGVLTVLLAAIICIIILIIKISIDSSSEKTAFRESDEAETSLTLEPIVVEAEAPSEVTTEAIAEEPVAEEEQPEEVVEDEVVWHFYNLDLQDNGDILDDYNFGPNPIMENVSLEKVKNAIQGKKATDTVKVQEIIEMLNPEEIREDQIKRMHDDTKLGAADMAWADSILGTRYLGVFYSAAKEQWDVAMNDAADYWIENEGEYNKALSSFERKLNHANKVEIRYVKSGLTDQMYMEPDGKNEGVPDIVVMETDKHDGWFIVYTYIIKETKTLEIMYRIDCGYQPTNVSKVMNITPKKRDDNKSGGSDASKKPDKTPNPTGGTATTTVPDPDPGPGPGPGPKPTPKPKKDPTKGTDVDPNDDKGPGEDTNTGKGSKESKKEEDSNSNNQTPSEYKDTIDEMKDANSNNGPGNQTPSTPSTPGTSVDNNAGDGTGNGGIDKPTEVKDSSVSDDKAGGSWDGPSG